MNRSTAVMASRKSPPKALDFFPTPPWAVRAMLAAVPELDLRAGRTVWEPACGTGEMARVLAETGAEVWATDIFDYGGTEFCDFTDADSVGWAKPTHTEVDAVVTNPPFSKAFEFAHMGLLTAQTVALLVRTSWLESRQRHQLLFEPQPPAIIAQYVERVPMVMGRLDPKASSASSYCWVIWLPGHSGATTFRWIPAMRSLCERPGDYPQAPAGWLPLFGRRSP